MQVNKVSSSIPDILRADHEQMLKDWVKYQMAAISVKADYITEASLRAPSAEFIELFRDACQRGDLDNIEGPGWEQVRAMLNELSRTRAVQGFSPNETAVFVFSFKQPLFDRLREHLAGKPEALAEQTWLASKLLDQLGLFTFDVYMRSREDIIRRQQHEMIELSTPVIKVWDGVLAVPLIGTLDSMRTQAIMESLLEKIVETESKIAILDITGVPTVDTQVAQHLLKTVSAAKLMGAECIISGIRPQIAQTIVHLGIDIYDIKTKPSMADAVRLALSKGGWSVTKNN